MSEHFKERKIIFVRLSFSLRKEVCMFVKAVIYNDMHSCFLEQEFQNNVYLCRKNVLKNE